MYDVIIVGSGPAGLSAAVYAKRAMLNVAVIEKMGYSGGQIVNAEKIDNYLGLKGMDGFEMAMKFREHAEYLNTEFIDGEVIKVEKKDNDEGFIVELKDGNIICAKTVIVATGAGHRKLKVPGEKEYTGKGVSYCATCDGAFFKEKQVAVVGGGDVALGDALHLSNIASKVYLVHRRKELRGSKNLQDKVFKTENIEYITDSIVTAINGDGKVSSVNIRNTETGQEISLDVSGVFVAVGMRPETDFLMDFVNIDEKGYIIAGDDGVTNVPGVFAAGDVRVKRLRQIITAASDGACVVASVEDYLNK